MQLHIHNPVPFFDFIYERQAIWKLRDLGQTKAPWTNDDILSKYKFCNVYRELDACSQHLIQNIINNKALALSSKIFNIIMYRRFNVRNFYGMIIPGPVDPNRYDFEGMVYLVDTYRKTGGKVFNDAYKICQRYYTDKTRKHDKAYQQLAMLRDLARDWDKIFGYLIVCKSLAEAHDCLMVNTPLTGPFLAYQYLTDITYIKEFRTKWKINEFTNVGPGARPAIDWMRFLQGKTYEDKCRQLWDEQAKWFRILEGRTGKKWGSVYYKSAYYKSIWLSLSNIQNCLCEFRKYTKLRLGQTQRKRLFKGGENELLGTKV